MSNVLVSLLAVAAQDVPVAGDEKRQAATNQRSRVGEQAVGEASAQIGPSVSSGRSHIAETETTVNGSLLPATTVTAVSVPGRLTRSASALAAM